MKTVLVYPPFCSPASPPYSITNLHAFLKNNLPDSHNVSAIDLNIEFHKLKFPKFQSEFKKKLDQSHYQNTVKDFLAHSKKTYSENNKIVVELSKGKSENQPEFFSELSNQITSQKPDIVAFSLVYSSQSFYAYALMKELKQQGIKVVIGGPAINESLAKFADACLEDEEDLFNYILKEESKTSTKEKSTNPIKKSSNTEINRKKVLDFTIYKLKDYFTSEIVLPLKTTSTCYYQQCSFCSHHNKRKYEEFSLEDLEQTIKQSKCKYFFIVDDMIHKKRLLELGKIMKKYGAKWMCQLKPTKDLDKETLKELKLCGLDFIIWGFESASNRILDLMKKQTNKIDMAGVIKDSKAAGIKNILFVMFGFPTETKTEFMETLDFLKDNQASIDLISTSVFGLQKDTPTYRHPEQFGIINIIEEKRTVLEPKISYQVKTGLSCEEAKALKKAYKKTLDKFNKYPKEMNFFREHMFTF